MVDCPAGYYCLNGYKKACPPGTYSDVRIILTNDYIRFFFL